MDDISFTLHSFTHSGLHSRAAWLHSPRISYHCVLGATVSATSRQVSHATAASGVARTPAQSP